MPHTRVTAAHGWLMRTVLRRPQWGRPPTFLTQTVKKHSPAANGLQVPTCLMGKFTGPWWALTSRWSQLNLEYCPPLELPKGPGGDSPLLLSWELFLHNPHPAPPPTHTHTGTLFFQALLPGTKGSIRVPTVGLLLVGGRPAASTWAQGGSWQGPSPKPSPHPQKKKIYTRALCIKYI